MICQLYSWTLPEALIRAHRLRNHSWKKILLSGVVFNGQKSGCEIRQCEFYSIEDKDLYFKRKKTVTRKNYIRIPGKAEAIAWFFNTNPHTCFSCGGSDSVDNHSLFHFKCSPVDKNGSRFCSLDFWLSTVNFAKSSIFIQFHCLRNQLSKPSHLYKEVLPRPKHCLFDYRCQNLYSLRLDTVRDKSKLFSEVNGREKWHQETKMKEFWVWSKKLKQSSPDSTSLELQ